MFPYTAIDEFTRLRFLATYPEQFTSSSADFLNGCSSGMHTRAAVRSAPKQTMALNSPTVFQQQARSATLYEATAAELGICTTARWSAAIGRIRSDFILAIAFTR